MVKILMHKDTPVARFETNAEGKFQRLLGVENETLLPDWTKEYEYAIKKWLLTRERPSQIAEFAPQRNFYGKENFKSESLASFCDAYWVKKEGSSKKWEDVSPWENCDPRIDSFFAMVYDPAEFEGVDESSPNVTVPGTAPVVWYDFGNGLSEANENAQGDVRQFRAACDLGYSPLFGRREYLIAASRVFSAKRAEVAEDVEVVPFEVYYNSKADPSKSKAENIKAACEAYGIPYWKSFMKDLVGYCKAAKKPVSLSQIWVLRDADSLDVLGFAGL